MAYVVYILRCTDNSLYTGITNDLPKRLAVHQRGKGGSYTRSHPPEKVVYTEHCRTKNRALRRELEVKKLTRMQKLRLISAN